MTIETTDPSGGGRGVFPKPINITPPGGVLEPGTAGILVNAMTDSIAKVRFLPPALEAG